LPNVVSPHAGIQLLKKMGWRQGRGIGAVVSTGRGRGGSRWGRSAGTAPDPVSVFAPPPKDDQHGLGFDPFKASEGFTHLFGVGSFLQIGFSANVCMRGAEPVVDAEGLV